MLGTTLSGHNVTLDGNGFMCIDIAGSTVTLKESASIRAINAVFRKHDQSGLYPIRGKFNATERAIRRLRRNRLGLQGMEYAAALDCEISNIVNAEI